MRSHSHARIRRELCTIHPQQRSQPMAHRACWNATDGSAARCEHLADALLVYPRSETCEQCEAERLTWLALRLCLTCGWVACSDESPGQHAIAHYQETD